MGGKTKKVKAGQSALSIPELRRGFEHIEAYARRLVDMLVNKKITRAAAISDYSKEWRRVFHRTLPSASAEASIDFAMSSKPRTGSKGTKKFKQRGGSAPVNWDQQPGIYAAPTLPGQVSDGGYTLHAQVPNYVGGGFDAITWKDSLQAQCGKEDSTPILSATLGSNAVTQKGGKRGLKRSRKQRGGFAPIDIAYRPFDATNPAGLGQITQMMAKGQAPPASDPNPTSPAFTYKSDNPVVPDLKPISAIERNMSADVSSASSKV